MAGPARQRLRDLPQPGRDPELVILTGFGSGLAARAPGTWGTLAALPFWWFLLAPLDLALQLMVIAATFALGIWLSARAARRHGLGDDPAIVIDEFVGLWVTLLGATQGLAEALLGFALFRLFDIWKPWPVSVADRRVRGALGVMLDDLLAGVYALGVLTALRAGLGDLLGL